VGQKVGCLLWFVISSVVDQFNELESLLKISERCM